MFILNTLREWLVPYYCFTVRNGTESQRVRISCSRLQCILPNLLGWLFYVRTRGTEVGVGCSRRDVVYSYGRNCYRLLSASRLE